MFAILLVLFVSNYVIAGNPLDDFKIFGAKDPCSPTEQGIRPHPKQCQLYFNCSKDNDREFENHWLHVEECMYPDLFNAETLRCEPYKEVTCGKRQQFVDPCDYQRNKCNGPHCIPCSARWPHCEVRHGLTHHQGKIGSPFYALCEDWRVVQQFICKKGTFDVATKKCRSSTVLQN